MIKIFLKNSVVYRGLACRKCNQVKQGETPATIGTIYGTKKRPNGMECHKAPSANIQAPWKHQFPSAKTDAHVGKEIVW